MGSVYVTKTIKGENAQVAWDQMQEDYDTMERIEPDSTFGTHHGNNMRVYRFDPNNDMGITIGEYVDLLPKKDPWCDLKGNSGVIDDGSGEFLVFGWCVD